MNIDWKSVIIAIIIFLGVAAVVIAVSKVKQKREREKLRETPLYKAQVAAILADKNFEQLKRFHRKSSIQAFLMTGGVLLALVFLAVIPFFRIDLGLVRVRFSLFNEYKDYVFGGVAGQPALSAEIALIIFGACAIGFLLATVMGLVTLISMSGWDDARYADTIQQLKSMKMNKWQMSIVGLVIFLAAWLAVIISIAVYARGMQGSEEVVSHFNVKTEITFWVAIPLVLAVASLIAQIVYTKVTIVFFRDLVAKIPDYPTNEAMLIKEPTGQDQEQTNQNPPKQ